MTTITIDKAKDQLAELVKRALDGELIVIADENQTPVRLTPMTFNEATARRRGYGALKRKLVVGPEFFEPLSDEECGYGDDGSRK